MYQIGIIGNGPERFNDPEKIIRAIDRAVDLLGFQYNKNTTIFNIKGDIGVGLWTAESCIKNQCKYHLFLPFPLEQTYANWYDEQKTIFENQYRSAHSLTICNDFENTHKCLIDASNFVVIFWAGNRGGKTFRAVKYALEHDKIVIDGLNELRLITNRNM